MNEFSHQTMLRRLLRASLSKKLGVRSLSAPVEMESTLPSSPRGISFIIETYGCQMNTSDSEIVRSLLKKAGHKPAESETTADLVLLNTCAIRENAEAKIWHRLNYFQSLRNKNRVLQKNCASRRQSRPIVGVLGCMAERLKDKLLDEESVDFVCGPDAYRDVPRLIDNITSTGQKEANTQLSLEETYADIRPVREAESASAFISIMRGCNNMCAFCIVPFTRGRERSRPMRSIIEEVHDLVKHGTREVCLLGQNVNGYHDTSPESAETFKNSSSTYKAAKGFTNLFNSRTRDAPGARFADLLEAVADVSPELRVRFTSPHPKDFSDDVLNVIASRPNICKALHLPVQSGSTSTLQRMRRGYSREAFLDLVNRARSIIGPDLTISTDLISGFCGETEEEHAETVSLVRQVQFDQAFMFAYSLREKTYASHNMKDDVPETVKLRRLQEVIETFRSTQLAKNRSLETNSTHLVLIEGESTRSQPQQVLLTGRTDGNKRVIFPFAPMLSNLSCPHLPDALSSLPRGDAMMSMIDASKCFTQKLHELPNTNVVSHAIADLVGKYVVVRVVEANGPTLRAVAFSLTTASEYHERKAEIAQY